MFAAGKTKGAVATAANYIEDVFSTYLYDGTGSGNQSITNNIDLAGKGGLVWIKGRATSVNSNAHVFFDTVRGREYGVQSINTNQQQTSPAGYDFISFDSSGFTVSANNYNWALNPSGASNSMASWTFRKQPKFFDVVQYIGNGTTQNIAHSLGSVPGCIIVKRVDLAQNWAVYHQSLGNTKYLSLNSTNAQLTSADLWNSTTPTSTQFSVGADSFTNSDGYTYIAYLFAHNAGGFGLTGTDNVISCGSFTCDGSGNATVNLGYEPQWVLMKASSTAANWQLADTMRGMSQTQINQLVPNTSSVEGSVSGNYMFPTATGFQLANGWGSASQTFIYIAIRKGPMKVPTDGTKVFNALSRTGTAATTTVSTTIQPDLVMSQARGGMYNVFYDRLRGAGATLSPNLGTDAESVVTNGITAFNNTSYTVGTDASQNRINWNTYTYANWLFSRAPSFFDEVCYTGTGTNQFLNHNLGVRPDLYIVKRRNFAANWVVTINASIPDTVGILNSTNAFGGSAYDNGYLVNGTVPASNFGAGFGSVNNDAANRAGNDYVAYLFATCPGVSKVGSYTGNGTTQTINCGFTGGARFVLIKRTDSTGDWYVYDTARGMTTLTDPYLLLNSTAAESATLGSVTTVSTGFAVNASILAAINTNGASYIYLSIA